MAKLNLTAEIGTAKPLKSLSRRERKAAKRIITDILAKDPGLFLSRENGDDENLAYIALAMLKIWEEQDFNDHLQSGFRRIGYICGNDDIDTAIEIRRSAYGVKTNYFDCYSDEYQFDISETLGLDTFTFNSNAMDWIIIRALMNAFRYRSDIYRHCRSCNELSGSYYRPSHALFAEKIFNEVDKQKKSAITEILCDAVSDLSTFLKMLDDSIDDSDDDFNENSELVKFAAKTSDAYQEVVNKIGQHLNEGLDHEAAYNAADTQLAEASVNKMNDELGAKIVAAIKKSAVSTKVSSLRKSTVLEELVCCFKDLAYTYKMAHTAKRGESFDAFFKKESDWNSSKYLDRIQLIKAKIADYFAQYKFLDDEKPRYELEDYAVTPQAFEVALQAEIDAAEAEKDNAFGTFLNGKIKELEAEKAVAKEKLAEAETELKTCKAKLASVLEEEKAYAAKCGYDVAFYHYHRSGNLYNPYNRQTYYGETGFAECNVALVEGKIADFKLKIRQCEKEIANCREMLANIGWR